VAVVVAALLAGSVAPALADDLGSYLDEAEASSYAGRQATWSTLDGDTTFGVVSVEHAGSMTMVEGASGDTMIGAGRVFGSSGAVVVHGWSAGSLSDRYQMAEPEAVKRLGRDATLLTIVEGDAVRARIWLDDASSAPLGSEVYEGDGSLFRLSYMLDFTPNPTRLYAALRDGGGDFDVALPSDRSSLPPTADGYRRLDVYTGPGDVVQAFFTDGLFSFSVFEVEGSVDTAPFSDGSTVEINGSKYLQMLTPSEVWVVWKAGSMSYVLVGDLPPDHLAEVLGELPHPDAANLFQRIWRGLFG
jgi:hypothetical protein